MSANYFYMQPGRQLRGADLYGQAGLRGRRQHDADEPPQRLGHRRSLQLAAHLGERRHRAIQFRARARWGRTTTTRSAALLFPFSTINADGSANKTEITPYAADPATGLIPSADFMDTPRADGDTCFAMALMLCYNQFAVTPPTDGTLRTYVTSSPITFPTGMAGGMGRKGAQKVIIFETDGLRELLGDRQPRERRDLQLLPDSL